MKLVAPAKEWEAAFLEMAAECQSSGDSRYDLALTDFQAYLQRLDENRTGLQPPGRVNSTEWWLEDLGRILACVRIRVALTPELQNEGGHVGYDVRPTMRRQGHGTRLLQLALPILRRSGITRVRITCDDDNVGSAKVIESNGGVLAGLWRSNRSGKTVRQYWIDNT